jgi:hypothetical protein
MCLPKLHIVPSTYSLGERIDVVQPAGFDQRSDDGTVLGATFGACEERIFPVEDDRTDGAFDGASKCASVPRECLADGVGRTCPFEWSDQGLCVATSGMHRRAGRPLCCRVRRRFRHCGRECSSIANNSAMCIRGCPHMAQTGGWKTGRACPLCPTASVPSCAFAICRSEDPGHDLADWRAPRLGRTARTASQGRNKV